MPLESARRALQTGMLAVRNGDLRLGTVPRH